MKKKKILILGCNGMLGHVLLREFSEQPLIDVYGTTRKQHVPSQLLEFNDDNKIFIGVEGLNIDTIKHVIDYSRPSVIINCIGVIKQLKESEDPILSMNLNSRLPRELNRLCEKRRMRLIHFSTDCVFKGDKGNYAEDSHTDADDIYGMTKALGEVLSDNALVIRTSIIGHELETNHGLLEWFLSQEGIVKGYDKALYSGFPTITLARIIKSFILDNQDLSGIINIASNPISKYELLKIIAQVYKKKIDLTPDTKVKMNRSLNPSLFSKQTGFLPNSWEEMIQEMYNDYEENSSFYPKRNY